MLAACAFNSPECHSSEFSKAKTLNLTFSPPLGRVIHENVKQTLSIEKLPFIFWADSRTINIFPILHLPLLLLLLLPLLTPSLPGHAGHGGVALEAPRPPGGGVGRLEGHLGPGAAVH